MSVTSADAIRLADGAIAASNALVDMPGAGPMQAAMMQVAASYTIAAAILDLAAAVREKDSAS